MTLLRRRMTEDMQVRNFSPHTQDSYVQQVSLFARYFRKSPEVLGPEEIRSYQIYLTNEKKLAPSSILIAVSALRFLYKVTLHRDWCLEDIIPAPKKPQKLPIVMSAITKDKHKPSQKAASWSSNFILTVTAQRRQAVRRGSSREIHCQLPLRPISAIDIQTSGFRCTGQDQTRLIPARAPVGFHFIPARRSF